MNKKIFLITSTAAFVFFSSCLTSLQNLVTYENVTNDDRIAGTWKYGDVTINIEDIPTSAFFKSITAVTVKGEEKKTGYDSKEDSLLYSRSYVVGFIKNNYRYYMICCLTRIGNDLYADIQPAAAEPLNKPTAEDINYLFSAGSYITSHSIAKVVFSGNQMEFSILNGDFIKEQLNNGSVAIKYEKDNLFNITLVTSSADNLSRFLSKYGDDKRLYSRENTITLKKI